MWPFSKKKPAVFTYEVPAELVAMPGDEYWILCKLPTSAEEKLGGIIGYYENRAHDGCQAVYTRRYDPACTAEHIGIMVSVKVAPGDARSRIERFMAHTAGHVNKLL